MKSIKADTSNVLDNWDLSRFPEPRLNPPVDNRQEPWYSYVDNLQDMTSRSDLLQGTLDLLILKTLEPEPMHGFGISQRIQQVSQDVFQVNQGSLYPALHRLEHNGWIESEWATTGNNRKAKYYRLTRSGKKQLVEERKQWEVLSGAIARILETA